MGWNLIYGNRRDRNFARAATEHGAECNSFLRLEGQIRRTSWNLAPVLVLALAVFAWGLQYKLSLYHSEARRTGVPEAKLLSPRERPASIAQLEAASLTCPLFSTTDRYTVPTAAALPSDSYLDVGLRIEHFLRPQQDPSAPRFRFFSLSNPRAPPIHA